MKSKATPAKLTVDGKVSEAFARTKLFLQQHIFNSKHSETEMVRYMTMFQFKYLSLTISMISLGSGIMKLNSVVYLASRSWPEVMIIMLKNDMNIKWIDESQGVSLKKFMSAQHRNQTEDVKENMLKGLIIVDIELVTVKHHRAWVDEADKNSQCLETYYAMRKTMESECEAKDQITEQINKYARNGGRRY